MPLVGGDGLLPLRSQVPGKAGSATAASARARPSSRNQRLPTQPWSLQTNSSRCLGAWVAVLLFPSSCKHGISVSCPNLHATAAPAPQFAHGREELRPVVRHPKYKTEICR